MVLPQDYDQVESNTFVCTVEWEVFTFCTGNITTPTQSVHKKGHSMSSVVYDVFTLNKQGDKCSPEKAGMSVIRQFTSQTPAGHGVSMDLSFST